jgi:hypothetical protein
MEKVLLKVIEHSEFELGDCSDVLCEKRLSFSIIQAAAQTAFQTQNVVVVPELFGSNYLIDTPKDKLPFLLIGEYENDGWFKYRYDFLFYDPIPDTNNIVTFLLEIIRKNGYRLVLDNFILRNQISYVLLTQQYLKEIFLDFDQKTGVIIGIEKIGAIYWEIGTVIHPITNTLDIPDHS